MDRTQPSSKDVRDGGLKVAPAATQGDGTTEARQPDKRAPADTPGTTADTPGTAHGERAGTSARPRIAARGASAARTFILLLSRAVRLAAWLVVLIIVAGILLRVLGANTSNAIVHDIHTAAKTLIGPFSNVFKIHRQKTELAVNWGLAALVYLILGTFLAGLIAKMAPTKTR